jgi:hypothetical protein
MILPFSVEISGVKQPYVTYAIIILCLLIHAIQAHNRGEIDQVLTIYCSSIYAPSLDEYALDALRLDEDERPIRIKVAVVPFVQTWSRHSILNSDSD